MKELIALLLGRPTASQPERARGIRHSQPRPLALEQRFMFDGAAVTAAVEATHDAQPIADAGHSAGDSAPDSSALLAPAATGERREIVFIDTGVPDWQALAAAVKPGVETILLDPASDELAQIAQALQGRSNIDAIHIVSHGAEGDIVLGNLHLTEQNLAQHSDELAVVQNALSADGDLLLYGCDIGAGANGLQLLGSLASLTGADVAASSNDTGGGAQGDWSLEQYIGSIETQNFGDASLLANFDNRLSGFNLAGTAGWVPIMYGPMQDPVGDSQAGAADTDIVGDATHGSLYTYYDDRGTTSTADDMLAFRLRIDNPTSSSNFGGVAIVGMDANADGRIDLFFSVDGRNNTQAVRLLDPGTGLNTSPNTTTTSPLPTGWLANNGVYPFSGSNYSVVAVSGITDPHWSGDSDLGNDGKTDVFVNWQISMSDIATVLAKASPVDRNGVYGPRGAAGIAGFTKDTGVQYVSFTQTQPGPINGDLNGVGASYDKNATFSSLGAFTAPMTASAPIAAGPVIKITSAFGDGVLNDSEDNSVTIVGTTTSISDGTPLSLTVSDGTNTLTFTNVTTVSGGAWSASGLDLSTLDNGTLTVTASVDPDNNAGTNNSISDSATVLHDKTAPAVSIDQLASAISGRPTFTGTSDLPDGSLVTITIDPDNNSGTANSLVYQVAVSGGLWSLNTAVAVPVSGSMPASGLTSVAKVSATATDAAGNSATAVAQNRPTVNTLSTNDTTPTITGTWTNIAGDALTVSVNGVSYTAGDGNLAVSGNSWSLMIPNGDALSVGTYSVTASVSRGGNLIADTTSTELAITSTPIPAIDIAGGTTANGTDTSPLITGTSSNAGGYVIVRLDPNNDGNLADAVTYSVVTDGSGNWSLDTGSAQPISGTVPSGGFIGAVGIRATDASGNAVDTQVLTVSTPTIAIGAITSTASTDANGIVSNSGGGQNYLNATEDNAVTVSGTATNGFTVDLLISDAVGNSLSANGLTVTAGAWSATGLDLSSLDNSTLTVKATLSGTAITATDTSVTHDKTAPFILNTTQSPIRATAGAVIKGVTDLPAGTVLTIRIYTDSGYTALAQTVSATVQSDGSWSTSTSANLGNNTTAYFRVSAPANTSDSAGNLVQAVQFSRSVQNSIGNSSRTIDVKPITGDNLLTVSDIAGNVTIQGETSATSSTVTVVISQNGSTLYTKTTTSAATHTAGTNNWSVTLTPAEVQAMANGQILISASAPDGSITISDAELVTVKLDTPTLAITDDVAGTATGDVTFTFTFSEAMTGFTAADISVTGGTKGTFSGSGTTYTLVVSPTAASSGAIQVSVNSSIANGSVTGRGNASASATQAYDTTGAAAAPSLTIDTDNLASDSTPVITGTTSLAAGAPIIISIDTNNDGVADLTYSATVQSGGTWSLDIGSATPSTGSLPADGLPTGAKIIATATNAYGNSTSATGLNTPVVTAQTTNDNTPTITGTWTQIGGDTLSVVVNGVTYSVANGNLTVGATSWSLTPSLSLSDGTYSVSASVTRSGATKTDLTSSELIIDTAGSVDIAGGASVTTNDATPVIAGTTAGLPNGTVLTLEIDSDNNGSYDLVYHAVVSNNAWSIDTASAIPYSGAFPSGGLNGSVPMRASASDAAGNSGLDAQTLIVDVTPPVIGITSSSRTPDTTPIITGTTDLPGGTTITVDIDPNNDGDWSDQQTYTATVQNDGSWSITASTPLSGTVGVKASGTDAAGNTTTTTQTLVIDLAAPTLSIDKSNASIGNDNSADASEDDAIVLNGSTSSIAAGSPISVLISDGITTISDTATVDADGNWILAPLNLSSMNNGTIYVSATYVDNAGNAFTDTFNFAHAKASTVSIDSISQDTGAIGDFVTKDNTVAIGGSATANASVAIVVTDASNATVATFNVTANGSGQWSTAATSALASGDYTISATVGGTTATHALTIVDATPPLLSSSAPLDNAGNVGVNNNLTLTFNKNIQFGSGTINLYRADNTLIESFNVNTLTGSDGGTLSVNSATITLDPGSSLATATGYYLTIDSTAISDTVGNNYAGINNATTLNFTTSASADVTPPAAPSIDLLATSDTGASNSDDTTGDNTPTLRVTLNGSGAAAPVAGDVAKIYADGVLVGSATLSAQNISDGYVDITSSALSDGTISFTAIVTDAANNDSSASSALPVVIDTNAPAPTIALNAVTSDGVLNASEAAGAVTITGSVGGDVQNGDSVTLIINGQSYTGTVSGGAFSISVAGSDLLADADQVIGASIAKTDSAGNTGTANATRSYVIDTTAPAPTIALNAVTSDGVLNASEAAGTVTITGSVGGDAQNGDSVTLTINGQSYTGTVSGGAFSISVAGSDLAADADHIIDASIAKTDSAGNTGTANATRSYVIDTTAPAPTIALDAVTSDGVLNASEAAGAVTITGSVGGDAQNGDSVTLTINGQSYTGTVSGGAFSISVAGSDLLADADHVIDASMATIDSAGNSGSANATRSFTTDVSAPILSSSTPTDNATNVGVNNNIALTFSESVVFGSGAIALYRGDNTLIESFDVGTLTGSNGGTLTRVGTTVTLDPGAALTSGTNYYIVIDSAAVTDTAGNNYAGINNATTLNFTTSASADVTPPAAPSIDLLATSDTGASNSDDTTGDNTPTLRVTLNGSGATAPVAGDVAKIYADGVLVGSATLSAQNVSDGYVDITSSVLSDGPISFTAIVTDAANNDSSASSALPVVIDTNAPAPTIALDAVTSDGVLNASEAAGAVTITGSVGGDAQNGDSVTLTINGQSYTGTVSGGAFSISVAGSDLLADADLVIDASIAKTDSAGNTGTANATRSFTVDLAPSAATLTLNPIAPVSSTATGGMVITGAVGGDARDGDIVTLVMNGRSYTGVVSGGAFSVDVDVADLLADTDRTLSASIATTSATGNSGVVQQTLNYAVTTPQPPAPPPIDVPPAVDIPPPVNVPPVIAATEAAKAPTISTVFNTSVGTAEPASNTARLSPAISSLPSALPGFYASALGAAEQSFAAETAVFSYATGNRSAANEVLTAPGENAFRVAVIKSNEEALMLFKGVTDQQAELSDGMPIVHFVLPADVFAHTNPKAVIYLMARLANGEQLPDWLSFNPATGTFEGVPPAHETGDVQVVVIARDNAGREASATFRVQVQAATNKVMPTARASLSELIQAKRTQAAAR